MVVETKFQRYRRTHKEELRERLYRWRAENPEKSREIARKSRLKHKEERNKKSRKYRVDNLDKLQEYDRERYLKNGREKRRKYYYKHREECIMAVTNRINLKKTVGDGLTVEQWRDVCERFDNRCAYCGVHEDVLKIIHHQGLTMDHVIPLSKGGEHSIENIVPACLSCNAGKGAKSWLK